MTLRSLRPTSISSRYATRLAVALTLGCAASAPAYALRLAHSRIVSAPNAPLQVIVGIAELTPDEQRTLMATLADPAAWQQAGVTPPVPLSSMTLRLEGGGNPTRRNLRIFSTEAAQGPVVDLLLKLGTSEGQRQVQVSMTQSSGGFPGLTSQAQVGSGARPARGAGAVAVRPGDTLYGIAQSNAVADATLYQMLVALWRANPRAFIQNNMNLVKAGVTLVVPDAATVRAIDPAEARRIFIQQQEAYARYRASLAGAAAAGAAATAGSATAGQLGGAPSTAVPETPPQDRLRLSSGQPGEGGADAQAQADAQTSIAKATEDAQQRVDQLERNVKELNDALAGRAAQGNGPGAGREGGGAAAGADRQGGGLAVPGLGGAAAPAANGGSAASAPRSALAQAGTPSPSAGAAPQGAASSSSAAAAQGGASQPGVASQSGVPQGGASQPGVASQSGAPQTGTASQPGAGAPQGASPPAGTAAGSAGGAALGGSQNGGQAGASTTDTAKPGISGDASALGGTSGTSGTPGSPGATTGGASAQAGGAAGGTGLSPSGAGSAASPSTATSPSGAGSAASPSNAGSAASPSGPGNAASASGPSANPDQSVVKPEGAAVVSPGATDDTGTGAKTPDTSGLPSWLSDNLLIILTAVLAVVAFVIAWLLRRAAVRRDEDQDDLDDELYMSEIDQSAIDRRLDGINLDLDEPPAEADRPRPGPVRT